MTKSEKLQSLQNLTNENLLRHDEHNHNIQHT